MPYKDPEKRRNYHRNYMVQWRLENPDYDKEWYNRNLEQQRVRSRNKMAKVRSDDPEYNSRYYEDHKEQEQERSRRKMAKWRAEHPEENRLLIHAHGAKRRALASNVFVKENVKRLVVAERDSWTCGLCNKPINPTLTYINAETGRPDPWYLNIDHIIPLSKGGDHSYANSQATHARCNNKKSHHIAD